MPPTTIKTGLVSVTFRKLPASRVIELAREAGLDAIEWGGDVHVPAGQIETARHVGRLTREAGLQAISYGSYYVAGSPKMPFSRVLETGVALGVKNIRIWAGVGGSKETDEAERRRVIDDIRAAGAAAAQAGVTVSLERHGGTLADTPRAVVRLFQELDAPGIFAYWQPAVDLSHEEALGELRALLPWLSSVHVFRWVAGSTERLALTEGLEDWRKYLAVVASSPRQHAALLEFVHNDSEEAFLRDARTLREILDFDGQRSPSSERMVNRSDGA